MLLCDHVRTVAQVLLHELHELSLLLRCHAAHTLLHGGCCCMGATCLHTHLCHGEQLVHGRGAVLVILDALEHSPCMSC